MLSCKAHQTQLHVLDDHCLAYWLKSKEFKKKYCNSLFLKIYFLIHLNVKPDLDRYIFNVLMKYLFSWDDICV